MLHKCQKLELQLLDIIKFHQLHRLREHIQIRITLHSIRCRKIKTICVAKCFLFIQEKFVPGQKLSPTNCTRI